MRSAPEAPDTPDTPAAPAAPAEDSDAIGRLRADLCQFTVENVVALLGPVAHGALGREQPVPARRVVRASGGRDPLATLVGLFVLGLPATVGAVDRALPALGAAGAARLGLVDVAGGGADDAVHALVDLRPYAASDARGAADWWVVSDLSEIAAPGPLRADHVLGVGGASTTLARSTIRTPVDRVLDLGTGCGVQALHAARHARHVVATDTSARALRFAHLTLALNAVDATYELRRGDLLDPVAGERFDLVVSNPPFVITPRRPDVPAYEYRDGGRTGDDLVRELVTSVGDVLAPGGTAQLLANWEHRTGVPWSERVAAWLDGTGMDAWVVQREVQDPAEYAELWLRDGGLPDEARYEGLYRAWLEDFEARGVEAVGFGLVVLRRPADDGSTVRLRRLEEVRGGDGPLGEHLAASLAAHDAVGRLDDAHLLACHLRVAPDVTEERFHTPGAEDPRVMLLRQGGGFGRAVRADTALAAFVGACDGELPAGRLVAALAQLLDASTDDLAAELLPTVRGLVRDGFLLL